MKSPICIRQLPASEIGRLVEIDRSEEVRTAYACRDGVLHAEQVDWHVPPWHAEGNGSHSVGSMIRFCAGHLEAGGVLLGALDGERLAGVAILRYRLGPAESTAQLAFLHVSRPYRRQGIAARLTEEAVRLARLDGARSMYVSATPSGSAVGFYLSQGFRLTSTPDPALFALEPEDIHMIKEL